MESPALRTKVRLKGIEEKVRAARADFSGQHGFLRSGGRFTTIDVPAAFGIGTQALGINSEGDIVGIYFDGSNNIHGFLLSK